LILKSSSETKSSFLLETALREVLACPECRGALARGPGGETVRCAGCAAEFPLVEGIPVFTRGSPGPQEDERSFRDNLAREELRRGTRDLRAVAGLHHCIPAMQKHAGSFRNRFSTQDWILDIGTGYAWPWTGTAGAAMVIGIDLSLGNLRLAKRLLGESDPVLLLCADAGRLPLRDGVVSGVWSAQAFQLLPEPVFQKMQGELDRVLKPRFLLEAHHLHPAPLYRLLCRLRGKRLHLRGRCGPFETNRLSLSEWRSRWASFRKGRIEMSYGYSELFFHPEMGLRPRPYPVALERWLASHAPALAGIIARQGILRVETARS